MTVTVQEVVEALWVGQQYAEEAHMNPHNSFNRLIDRIEREGIAPSDGWVLVQNKPFAWAYTHPNYRNIAFYSHEIDIEAYGWKPTPLYATAPKPEVKS